MISTIKRKKQTRLGLKNFIKSGKKQTLTTRLSDFSSFIKDLKRNKEHTYFRMINSPTDRVVSVYDPSTRETRNMLMFASNNYLGLANDEYISNKVKETIDRYGTGLGGPAILNGYTHLMQQLESRIASLKHMEDSIIFPAGYSANLGLISAIMKKNDLIIFDELSHASFHDGIKLSQAHSISFKHNDMDDLERILAAEVKTNEANTFVCFEGVYSMDGDLARLKEITRLAKKYGALTVIDDAHGTGVLGKTGSGTAEYLNCPTDIDISMGTFSKTFAVTGGFVTASKEIINYLRYFARSYMFSASLPPITVATILAGMDILERKPWLRTKLLEVSAYAREMLEPFGFLIKSESPIIALLVPDWMNIRKANHLIHEKGIFLNAVEYPAVPIDKQRFRISVMAKHTKADIDHLVDVLSEVWNDPFVRH